MRTNKFTPETAQQIKRLLTERFGAPRNKQKVIRDKIRDMGFYINDYWKGFSDIDFDNEVKAGRITIE